MAVSRGHVSQRTYSFLSNAPLIGSAVGGAIVTLVVSRVSYLKVDVGTIFSGVFDITTILTGFLATFYVFVVARQNKFLEEIQHTQAYRDAVGLLRFTIYWSVSVILLSWLCAIVSPTEIANWSWQQAMVYVWAFNAILLTINFIRCASHFNTIISARSTK